MLYLPISLMLDTIPKDHQCLITIAASIAPTVNSLLHLAIVTLDRYIAIMYPLRYDTMFNTKRLVACIVSCWITSFIIVIPFIIIDAIQKKDLICRTHELLMSYIFLFTVGPIGLLIILAYIKIYKEILKQQVRIHSNEDNQSTNNNSRVKVAKLIFLTSGCFFISWLPMFSCSVIDIVNEDILRTSTIMEVYVQLARLLSIVNSAMNPIIYILRMQSFRNVLCKSCKSLKPCE